MLQRLSSLLLAVLAVAGLCCSSVSAQAGSGWQLYSFCYVTQNTLATSPYLLWSAYAQGTMNISTQASAGSYRFGTFNGSLQAQPTTGYAVYGITGFREVYAQGKALQSNQILGLVPVGAYGSNDNLINTTAPYFAAPHAVSFYLDGIAQYANGPAVYPNALRGSPNVTINGFRETGAASASFANAFSEGDQPPNDGQINVITNGFQLVPATAGFVNSYAGCTLTRPSAPSIPAATLTAYQAATTWPFCYQFESGANNVGNVQLITTTSGTFITTGYQGSSPSGAATGYLITNINGTRTFSAQYNYPGDSTSIATATVSLSGVGSPLSPYFSFPYEAQQYTSGTYRYTDNVLYPAFPNFDAYGVAVVVNQTLPEEFAYTISSTANGSLSDTQVFVLYTDASYLIYDVAYTLRYGNFSATSPSYPNLLPYFYADPGYADTLVVQTQSQFAATGLSLSAWTTATCGENYAAAPSKYSFCYFIDNTNATIPAAAQGVVSMYGTFTARTGLTRYGRPAMQLQSLSGIRTVFNPTTGAAISQSALALAPPNGFYEQFLYAIPGYYDFWLTDNVLFTQAPWFSEAGLGLTFSTVTNLTFPGSGVTTTPFYNIYSTWGTTTPPNQAQLVEAAVGDTAFPSTSLYAASRTNFSYAPFVAGSVAQCNAQDNKVSSGVQAYSFCWFRQSPSSGYLNMYNAVVYAYTTPLYRNGRPGYVVQTIVGTRTFADTAGIITSSVIAGVSPDYTADAYGGFNAQFTNGFGNAYDNLVYDSFPYLDSNGLLYQVVGPLGQVSESINDTVSYSSAYRGLSTGNGIAVVPYGRLWYDELNIEGTAAPALPNYYDETLFNVTDLYNISSNQLAGALWYYELLTGLPGNVALVKDGGAAAQSTTSFFLGQSCGAPMYQLMSFCYTLQNTLTTSPYLQWAVQVSGTLNVSMMPTQYWLGNPGYQIVGATGTRTIQYGGKTVTNNIVGVAPVSTFNWNDNRVNLAAPFITSIHAITFVLDGTANFAGGPILGLSGYANSTYVTIANWTDEYEAGAGFQEVDQPINDKIINNITSSFDLRLFSTTSTYTCPYTVPTITWASGALTSYSSTSQVAMCFSVSAGPGGYGTLTSGYYQIVTSLILTVNSFGATASGAPAYLITGAQGYRVYYTPQGTNITSPVTLAGINAGMHAFPKDYIPGDLSLFASNNIYYPQYPQMDGYGINLMGTQDVSIGQDGDTHSKVSRLLFNYEWEEQDVDGVTYPGYVYWWYEYSGSAVFAPYTNQDMSAGGAFAQQCLNSYGSQLVFSFCYAYNSSSWVSYANGLATVVGPQSRLNRPAYFVQGMTGVRTITLSNGTSQTVNIMNVQYTDQDTFTYNNAGYLFLSDNLIFASGVPELSAYGIEFNLSSNVLMQGVTEGGQAIPAGVQGGSSIVISTDGASSGNNFYEALGGASGNYMYSPSYVFKTAPYSAGAPLVSCAGSPSSSIPAPPSLTQYSFCYAFNGPQSYGYQIVVSGTVTVYNVAVTTAVGGATGYGIANITGTRAYADGQGRNYTAVIAGLSQDWVAEQNGWSYDQIFYPSAPGGSPVDRLGLLYKYSGYIAASNPTGVNYDRVVRLFSNASSPAVEEYFNTNGTQFTPVYTISNAQVQAGAAGAISAASCSSRLPANGYAGPPFAGFTGAAGSSSGSASGVAPSIIYTTSSSSLSHGAIAGIVVGVCVGAALFCALCFFLGAMMSGGKGGKAEQSTSKYNSQVDQSRVGASQVEMHPVEVSAVRPGEELETA